MYRCKIEPTRLRSLIRGRVPDLNGSGFRIDCEVDESIARHGDIGDAFSLPVSSLVHQLCYGLSDVHRSIGISGSFPPSLACCRSHSESHRAAQSSPKCTTPFALVGSHLDRQLEVPRGARRTGDDELPLPRQRIAHSSRQGRCRRFLKFP